MVSALDSGPSAPASSPVRGHYVALGKTLYSYHRQTTLFVRGLRQSTRVMNKVLKIAHLNQISV